MTVDSITIRTTIKPGDLGYLIYLHGILYAREAGFDFTFDAYVGKGMSDFFLSYTPQEDGVWIAEQAGQVIGSIMIIKSPKNTAQLRYFIVHPSARGQGIGRRLLEKALNFCRSQGYQSVHLWTVSTLDSAKHLYQSAGFNCTDSRTQVIWGKSLTEERYELAL